MPGARLVGDGATAFGRVHSDTRSLRPGDLFVALKGERFDAHDFLPQARASGAVAALATHGLAEAGLPGLLVSDTLAGLQQLATAWRASQRLPVIGVTGSNGKTTVTQMIASILRAAHGDRALATAGNLNNHIGVPLTVLRLHGHRAAVIELGMNHPGEIAELAAIAQPTVALVNNAQREHQEFMHTVEAVARENGSVICRAARPTAWRCSRPTRPTPRCGRPWPAHARHALCARRRGRGDRRRTLAGRPLGGERCTRPRATRWSRCASPAATTSRTRWPPARPRWPPAWRCRPWWPA